MDVFWKVILILVVLAVLKPIVRILFYLLLRTVFRKSLAGVGKQAMAEQPDRIHLTPKPGHVWADGAAVEATAAPLALLGFQEAGSFGIEEMNGVVVRFLVKTDQGIAACIYEHPQVGTWLDVVSRFQDGTSVTYTTSRPTGLEERPGTKTVNAPEMGSEALYHRMLRERPGRELEEITAANVVKMFEDAYARSTDWRKNRGISADEVARNIELAPVSGGEPAHQAR